MRILLLFLLTMSAAGAHAQVGVAGFYNVNEISSGSNKFQIDAPYDNGYEVAVNYWFRLPKKRVEFLPTLYYASAGDASEAGFQFKTNLYVFDFGTDCDCPTFGKQGPQLEKGFFLQLSPGVARHDFGDLDGAWGSGKFAVTLGAAVGVDIGVANLLTLTPIVGLRHSVTDIADIQFTDASGMPIDTRAGMRLTTLQLGLQATFRFDKKRY